MSPTFASSLTGRTTAPLKEPLAGQIISVILNLASLSILAIFTTKRFVAVKIWNRLPFTMWLIFGIYIDSYCFVFATGVLLFGFSIDNSNPACGAAILLCLVCYVSTKIAIYLFLVEKAHIVRGTRTPRLKSKLYIFNSFGMLGVYGVIVVLNFVFRFSHMTDNVCVIGMKKGAMIPLISFDILVNVYLTVLFLIPLSGMYSFRNKKTQLRPASVRLRTVAVRTFVGCLCTLTSSIVNLSVLMILEGEPGWICLMCCNSDILFSALVLQWVTSKDNAASNRLTTPGHTDGYYAQQHTDGTSSVIAPSAIIPCPNCRTGSIAAPAMCANPYTAAALGGHRGSYFAGAVGPCGARGGRKVESSEPTTSEISRTLSVEVLHEPNPAVMHISAVGRRRNGSASSFVDVVDIDDDGGATTAVASEKTASPRCCSSGKDDDVDLEERSVSEQEDMDDDEAVDEEAPQTVLRAPPRPR